MTCQGHTADRRWRLGFKPGSLVPELEFLPNVPLTLTFQKDDCESAHVTSPDPEEAEGSSTQVHINLPVLEGRLGAGGRFVVSCGCWWLYFVLLQECGVREATVCALPTPPLLPL